MWQVKLNTTEPRQRIIRAKDTARFKRDFEKKEEVIDITEQTTLFDWQSSVKVLKKCLQIKPKDPGHE